MGKGGRRSVLLVCAASVAAAVGCGGGDDSSSTSTIAPTSTVATATAVAAATSDAGATGTSAASLTTAAGTAPETAADRIDPSACAAGDAGRGAEAGGPVTVTTLHFWDDRIQKLVEEWALEFEASHPDVQIEFDRSQGSAEALALIAAQPPAGRADVVVLSDYSTAGALDLGTFVPVAGCGLDPAAFVPAIAAPYTIDGSLVAAPFTVSTPVLYYDRDAFVAAGLDPHDPPRTITELAAAAEQIVSSGAREVGLLFDDGWYTGGVWYVEQFAAQLGMPTFEPDNGRSGPATSVAWDDPRIVEVVARFRSLVEQGDAEVVDVRSDSNADLYRLIDTVRPAAMSIHTSGSLGPVLEYMDQQGDVDRVGIAPLPAVDASTPARSLVGGSALWLMNSGNDTELRAAREWVAFLTSPEIQAELSASSGYIPSVHAATSTPTFRAAAAARPQLRVAGEALLPGTAPGQLSPLSPVWEDARYLLADAVRSILVEGADPAATLAAAERSANELLGP